ncbi:MAG: M20/M25/M40 family metallo-hydrolase, partial [Bryobacteraceae bacterium]|nr:M20/M25/M40 family metallo-hydrolase [Bryobacteraceae bacterium]
MRLRFVVIFLMLGCLLTISPADLADTYRVTAQRLIDAALKDDDGYEKLSHLCYQIGNRLSGSKGLEEAVRWSAEQMKRDGLANVTLQPVKVPHWVRGEESAEVVEPVRRKLFMLGLGMSVGTPEGGITAEVVPVSSFDELTKLGAERVKGRIVLFNVPYTGYGQTVMYRATGASRAAAMGAVAVLVRSVTPLAMQQPHTGSLVYDPAKPRVPAAAISIEDSMMLAKVAQNGPVKVRLQMGAQTLPDADSANIFGEIPGREKPEEVVVLGGHIDSWDVGQGAQDDGTGVIASLQAVALIRKLGLQPRRTLRVVFWTNEENGTRGGRAYRAALGEKVGTHVAAIEMDGGAERPLGFGFGGRAGSASEDEKKSFALLQDIGKLLSPIGAGEISPGGGGADIGPLMRDGVPGLGVRTV